MKLSELTDDDGGDTEYHLMNIEYTEESGEPLVHLFTRTREREQVHIEVVGHKPSFYIRQSAFGDRIKNHQWVDGWETGGESIEGEPLVRLKTKLPKHIGGNDDIGKGLREYFEETWEADVFYTTRFLIDTDIKTHFTIGEEIDYTSRGDKRVHVDNIDPVDTDWSVEPRMVTLDIEVLSPDGFPDPDDAEQPVTAITAHDNYSDEYEVWLLRNDDWSRSDEAVRADIYEQKPDSIDVDGTSVGVNVSEVHIHGDESQLLDSFNRYVAARSPDMLSGWNSSGKDSFDLPYLINRGSKLNTYSYDNWSPLGQAWNGYWGPTVKGVTLFDMMDAYKKTRWSEPKGGYSLDNISDVELCGDGKLQIDDIDEGWTENPAGFIAYNIRDVQSVVAIDESSGTTPLYQNLRKLTGVQFENCHNNIDLLDPYFLRQAKYQGIALPTNEEPDRDWYYGAYVFEPELGRHRNVIYYDVAALYPNIMYQTNISPDTLIGTQEDLDASEYSEDDCSWAYIDMRQDNVKKADDPEYERCYYLKPSVKEGFLRQAIGELLELKAQYKGDELYPAVKRVVNSCFTPDTEVLTPDGLKNITDMEIGDDVYAMDHETGEMEVKPVVNLVEKPEYDGELYNIQNGRMHHTVTPDHEMSVRRTRHTDEWEVTEVQDLNEYSRYELPTSWEYADTDGLDEVSLYEYADSVFVQPTTHGHTFRTEAPVAVERHPNSGLYEIAADDYDAHEDELRAMSDGVWCRRDGRYKMVPAYIDGTKFTQLAAWYATEGNIKHGTSESVILSQQNERGRTIIKQLLDSLGVDYTSNDNCFRITSEVLSVALSELCGNGSHSKQFPRTYRDTLSTFQKRVAAVTFVEGDGRWENDDKSNARFTTHSEQLRDDILALFTECGHIARYQTYTAQSGNDGWRIFWRRDATHAFSMARNGSTTTMEDYEAETGESGVYCITVADNHTIIAGRNGRLSPIRQCYGVMGDDNSYGKGYRLYDWRLGESITLQGRKIIQEAAEWGTDVIRGGYVTNGDTDGVGISSPHVDNHEQAVMEGLHLQGEMSEYLQDWCESEMNIEDSTIEMEAEKLMDPLFIPEGTTTKKAKKRYTFLNQWSQ